MLQYTLCCTLYMGTESVSGHQGDDERVQQSYKCNCNYVLFYIEARPPCSQSLCEAPTPWLWLAS